MQQAMNAVRSSPRVVRILHIVVVVAMAISLPAPLVLARSIGSPDAASQRASPLAPAATIVVNTTADELNTDGDCSLREAIAAANTNAAVDACAAGSGADTVTLPAGIYFITLAGAGEDGNVTGDFDVTDADGLTIAGAGASATVIDANGLDRAIHVVAGPLTLNNLTVQKGSVAGDGGAVNMAAPALLELSNTNIFSSTAINGGGVACNSAAVLVGGQFSNNVGVDYGGGLLNFSIDRLVISGTQFISNTAGINDGGAGANGPVLATNGWFERNRALLGGGVATNDNLAITNTVFLSNTAVTARGGGAFAGGTASAVKSTFQGNSAADQGGGLYVTTAASVTGTAFIRNSAGNQGGGVYLLGTGTSAQQFVNVLFAANEGGSAGAAVYANQTGGDDTLLLDYTTIASPTVAASSAIYDAGGTLNITNTIVASHTIGLQLASGTALQNYNLFFGNTSHIVGTVSGGTGQVNADPRFVNAAGNNYALREGSPAINAAINTGVTTDFFGNLRPQLGGYDIGYDEFVDTPISGLSAANDSPTQLGSVTHVTATVSAGSNVTYAWNYGDGALGSGATAAHTYASVGTYTATVTATNSIGSVVATTPVTIVNVPISGLSAANDSPTQLGSVTHVTATVSAGSNVTYAWNYGDGALGSGATAAHTYLSAGTYTATVTATNSVGSVAATTVVYVLSNPIANGGPDQIVRTGAAVTLNGNASFDPGDFVPLTYHWEQTGGQLITLDSANNVTTTFTTPAITRTQILTFELTVTNTYQLASAPDIVVVTVVPYLVLLPLITR